jgi:hypothetical protein
MAAIIGDTGSVVSWANNTALISGGVAPSAFTLQMSANPLDATVFGSSLVGRSSKAGLTEVSGTIQGKTSPTILGSTGLVTASGAYTANVKSWTMELNAPPFETTAMTGAAQTFKSFIPGLISGTGSWTANVDHSTALVLPNTVVATATFKLVENSTGTDGTLSCAIVTTDVSFGTTVGELVEVTVGFSINGTITSAGTSATGIPAPLFAPGTITAPPIDELQLRSATNRTYTGDAFWSSIRINVPVNDLVTYDIGFQGTSTWTIA